MIRAVCIVAALTLVLPAVAFAAPPSTATLNRVFWVSCMDVAANSPKSSVTTNPADWPKGFRGCAAILHALNVRNRASAHSAWARWVAKHAAEEALIRKTAARLPSARISWTQFNQDAKAAAQKAAQGTP
jgi:hypothetical protein